MKKETPTSYLSTLLKPLPENATDRKVWSIPLAGVWLPVFMASNAVGESNIPADVLGAPVRLATEKDGTPRFNQSGRPVMRVVKELNDQILIVRENFTYHLLQDAVAKQKAHPEAYKAQVVAAQKAGELLIQKDNARLLAYLEELKAAEAVKANGWGPYEGPDSPPDTIPQAEPEKELVPA